MGFGFASPTAKAMGHPTACFRSCEGEGRRIKSETGEQHTCLRH